MLAHCAALLESRQFAQLRVGVCGGGAQLLEYQAQLLVGRAARERARKEFSADAIVPRYEALYRRVCQ